MTESLPHVYLQRDDAHPGLVHIVLNRAEKKNALNFAMWQLLAQAVATVAHDPAARVVIVRARAGAGSGDGASGPAFAAGGDIAEFPLRRANAADNRIYNSQVRAAVAGLRELACATIAMIDGPCVGGGMEIAVACDLRFAATTARFGVPPAKLGFVYDVWETSLLMELIGPGRAKDLLFSGRLIDAQEAYAMGLVERVVSSQALEQETFAYAHALLANAHNSIVGAKDIVNALVDGASPQSPDLAQIVDAALDSPHYREGVAAFIERRPPAFPTSLT
ncbi:MAG: enoyl-CoA hydratase-related protein [Firmicutes bacterium]|nr:enoyl-CoA hydratase-related protein [Bacillota bacterium]